MYYHVRIDHRLNESLESLTVNLSREVLEQRLLNPYREGTPITLHGITFQPDELGRIIIVESDKELGDWIPIFGPTADAENLRDVTDVLITDSPGWATREPVQRTEELRPPKDSREVFVIHGRNMAVREALFQFLRSIDLHPLEWTEAIKATGKPAPYTGEILNAAFSRAHAVVALFTPDDEVRLRERFRQPGDHDYEFVLTGQARPNVLFEAGMSMGLNEHRTILVEIGEVKPFSDVMGRHAIRLDNSTQRWQDLAQRLQAAGCPVNLSGTDWHTVRDFDRVFASLRDKTLTELTENEEDDIEPSRAKSSELSDVALELLKEAVQDQVGFLLKIKYLKGTIIRTNGKKFGALDDPRSQAICVAAVDELVSSSFIRDDDGKDETFTVTSTGYELIDNLGVSPNQ